MDTSDRAITVPALRASMGDWMYYVATMSLGDVAERITRTDQIHSNSHLREWIQRELSPRAGDIATYLATQPQRLFNAIIVGIYHGDPEWYPIEVGDSTALGSPRMDGAARGSIGLLRLTGNERIFAIDGQHRVEGIKRVLVNDRALAKERLAVIFVAHHPTDAGRQRTRRLFSTLNRYAKPVSKGEIVALDEDDAYAIVTRQLVERFGPLAGNRVAFSKNAPVPKNNRAAVTTILGLYEMVKTLDAEGREATPLRPPNSVIDRLYADQVQFWTALIRHVPELKHTFAPSASDDEAGKHRHSRGGHLLFRVEGQKVFAQAVRVLRARGFAITPAVESMARAPLNLDHRVWDRVLWDRTRHAMITKNTRLALNVLLRATGHELHPGSYSLPAEYFRAAGRRFPALSNHTLPKKRIR